MTNQPPANCPHAIAISAELDWLGTVIAARLAHFFAGETAPFAPPNAPQHARGSALGDLIARAQLDASARIVFALALAVQVNPAVLDPFFVRNKAIDRPFSEFGGLRTETSSFIPTAITALFLLGGGDTAMRIAMMALFAPDHALRKLAGLELGALPATGATAGTFFGGPLLIAPHRVSELCAGQKPAPDFSPQFPAKRLQSGLTWADLILPREVKHHLDHIAAWLANRDKILDEWGLKARLGHGFKALFYGPPGTGKTLTATLLGQRTGLDVYRIDLSMIVSKYIGETEKNLAQVFDMAEENNWILFFDEADALFGARGAASSANDRHANQEVAYLLQRIEECPALVILATNLRSNIDEAFFRRFQMAVGFPKPDAALRTALWHSVLGKMPLAPDVDLAALARDTPLAGGPITNVARHAAISALRRDATHVSTADLQQAIAGELRKEGRTR
ncbi:ATPase family associated with various cellular activities (AAA) [Yoonia tamlensis]|uniref:ATPase family associated with various cellular activities (AAA) n=1 Tax=Yoonia tamlensis TaxID=390270 RepID=A0A1I6GBZ1_9RHOB|nr:ATP-binding protein [Yoonia tamlensis]SFR39709.1 ATPase family associated with various cellular activities (AAA) [Yoonia tamlensis]